MTNLRISELDAVTDLQAADLVEIARSGASKKITAANLITALGAAALASDAEVTAALAALSGSDLSYVENVLSADVTMTNAGTYYDGPAVVLSQGTWLLVGQAQHDANGNGTFVMGKLWDGTTVEASMQAFSAAGAAGTRLTPVPLSGIVVIASGTPTWKISVNSNGGSTFIRAAAPDSGGAGNNASKLSAVKIAA